MQSNQPATIEPHVAPKRKWRQASAEPVPILEFSNDSDATPGNLLEPLAALLIALAEEQNN